MTATAKQLAWRRKLAAIGAACASKAVHTKYAGKLKVPQRGHPLVRRFFAMLNEQGTLISELADRAGLHPNTIMYWRKTTPNLVLFTAALNALDYDLAIVPRNPEETIDRKSVPERILECLNKANGRPISGLQIAEIVYGSARESDDNLIKVHISKLRASGHDIKNKWSVGYYIASNERM